MVLTLLFGSTANAVDFNWSLEAFGYGVGHNWLSSAINPQNETVQLPSWTAELDLRPEVSLSAGDSWRAVARPRLFLEEDWTQAPPLPGYNVAGHANFRFDDVYAAYTPNGPFSLSAGVQNFQWGPAELLGPSNPLFHFMTDERSALFRQQGEVLAKASYFLTANLSLIALVEPLSNGAPSWVAGEPFTPEGLVKLEQRFSNAGDYVGLTLGRMEEGIPFVGEYGTVYLNDAISVYADARESTGSPAYYPQAQNGGVVFTKSETQSASALVTAGIRWEGAIDTRLEYIFNSYGYDPATYVLALAGATLSPQNLAQVLSPGLELYRKHYLYLSLRTDRLGQGDKLRLSARYLLSLEDGSGSVTFPLEWSFTDNLTAILQPLVSYGTSTSEFLQAENFELLGAIRLAI